MRCPTCQSVETKVIDSRLIEEGHTIRRRRQCEHCDHRFTTFEKKSYTELMVIKKDGRKELYDRDKIKKALSIAFGKRKMNDDTIDNVINKLEIERSTKKNGLTSTRIGEDIVRLLKDTDPVAYVRFASVYLEFDDYTDFAKIIVSE